LDRIHIRKLTARAIIGVNPEERSKRQDVVVSITIAYHNKAGRTDRLEDAVDYRRLKRAVLEYVEGSKHKLLEALAEGIADTCLSHPGVAKARVIVDKPGALRFARSVGVEIVREKPASTSPAAREPVQLSRSAAAPPRPRRPGGRTP
jgi:D-erythro-7,8-dihydroneopterin triphosphate epimerase